MDDIDLSTLFSSKSDNWRTPQDLFDTLDREFEFALDAAADEVSAKCSLYLTEQQDALDPNTIWDGNGSVWLNPPYSLTKEFLERAYEESFELVRTVVCLIPARTDTKYWHQWVSKAAEVRFLKGRVKFERPSGEPASAAPFPSAVVVYRPGPQPCQMFNWDWRTT